MSYSVHKTLISCSNLPALALTLFCPLFLNYPWVLGGGLVIQRRKMNSYLRLVNVFIVFNQHAFSLRVSQCEIQYTLIIMIERKFIFQCPERIIAPYAEYPSAEILANHSLKSCLQNDNVYSSFSSATWSSSVLPWAKMLTILSCSFDYRSYLKTSISECIDFLNLIFINFKHE